MRPQRIPGIAPLLAVAALAACGGGTMSAPQTNPTQQGSTAKPTASPVPTPTSMGASTQQVVSLALPTTSIGSQINPTYGEIGGYTQSTYSQILGFAPGQQIMIRNGQAGVPHTLGDTGASGSFPAVQPAALSFTGTGSKTLSSGWQSGTIAPGSLIGPITLSAGTYLIGCAYHYQSNGMRDVLVVAPNATPGPQATPPPSVPTPVPTSSSNPYPGY